MAKVKDPKNAIVREPEVAGTEIERKDFTGKDKEETPVAPKTSGAPTKENDTSRSAVANRNEEGPGQAGTTPRHTDKPIVGGNRG